MSEVSSVQKKLKEILSSQKYAELKSYQDPKSWNKMTKDERELLGKLFIMHGKDLLRKGDKTALKTFNLATKAAPKCAKIFFQKGLAYSTQEQNTRSLNSACRAFEKATKLEPDYVDAWCNWAYTLLLLGENKSDSEILQKALEKFAHSETLLSARKKKRRAALFWHWGHCWHILGKLSGEAIDISQALDKYAQSEALGLNATEFWIDYGNACAEQASLLGRPELFHEVIQLFFRAVEKDPKDFEAWFSIACSFMRLYEDELNDDYFERGNDAFEQAAEIFSKNSSLWLCWGQLMLTSGKLTQDMDKIFDSSLKFEEADACEPGHPVILCRWAESLMSLGSYHENFQLIAQAQEKIKQSVDIDPLNPEGWYFYGRCLVELGRYFADPKKYIDALEKYRYGFSLNKSLKLFHYGMAVAYFELAEAAGDENALKQSLKHYSKLEEEVETLPPQFWLDWGVALKRYGDHSNQRHYVEAAMAKFEEAISMLGEDVEKEPLLFDCLFHYAQSLDLLGDMYDEPAFYEKAIQLFLHINHLSPDFVSGRYHLALSYAHLGELVSDIECLERSIEHFEAVVKEDPENEAAWNDWGISLLNLANLADDPSRPDYINDLLIEAEDKLHHAVALGNVNAYYNMAGYYSLTDNMPASLEYLEKAYQAHAMPMIDDVMHDEWLDRVRHTDEFRLFLSKLLNEKPHQH